jgi:hypothetical protein
MSKVLQSLYDYNYAKVIGLSTAVEGPPLPICIVGHNLELQNGRAKKNK